MKLAREGIGSWLEEDKGLVGRGQLGQGNSQGGDRVMAEGIGLAGCERMKCPSPQSCPFVILEVDVLSVQRSFVKEQNYLLWS